MIDVTGDKASAETKFELYLRAAGLLGQIVRMDIIGSSEPHDSVAGFLESVALNGESDFGDEDEDERSIWLRFRGDDKDIAMTVDDSLYSLDITGWALVNQGTLRGEEDGEY